MVFATPRALCVKYKSQKFSENPSPMQKSLNSTKKAFNCELLTVYYAHEETRRDAAF